MALFASLKKGNFEACPEYSGRGVIADVTPLKKQSSPAYGEREVFKVVVEVDLLREDGGAYCVWSNNMTPSLHEKANLRKFIKSVLGRDLTAQELQKYDVESLVGMPVHVVVVQNHKDGEVYANIALIQQHKTGEPLALSGRYVRVKDRPAAPAGNGAGAQGGYRRAEPVGDSSADLGATKIHVGRCKGLEVRDLAPEQVEALIVNWLPTAKENTKPTADDKRLIAALDSWQAAQAEKPADDNLAF